MSPWQIFITNERLILEFPRITKNWLWLLCLYIKCACDCIMIPKYLPTLVPVFLFTDWCLHKGVHFYWHAPSKTAFDFFSHHSSGHADVILSFTIHYEKRRGETTSRNFPHETTVGDTFCRRNKTTKTSWHARGWKWSEPPLAAFSSSAQGGD